MSCKDYKTSNQTAQRVVGLVPRPSTIIAMPIAEILISVTKLRVNKHSKLEHEAEALARLIPKKDNVQITMRTC